MSVDWDGQIRMDPSSSYAMQSLIGLKDRFDVSFACDTDHDRHGIVTRVAGLLPPNHYLASATFYLFQNRPLAGVDGNRRAGHKLKGTFHRLRQSGIYEELFDVGSGFEALSGAGRA